MPVRPATLRRRDAMHGEALAYLHANYASVCRIEDVARALSTSRRQLQRVMDTVGGASFRQTLTTLRMHKAADLLASQPEATVRNVCRAVGYSQPAQFAKAFRLVHGAPAA